jgi:hypothetical protein
MPDAGLTRGDVEARTVLFSYLAAAFLDALPHRPRV